MPRVRPANESDRSSFTSAWLASARRRLLAWYCRNARTLPWRETSDPYAIWVSEIMLQQTQVATVVPYFKRFLASFPTVTALAAAPEERVLRHWEGLGYYRRARQLHAAAKKIVAEHSGEFPRDRESILHLPGIGRYTTGAIMSIAFDARQPILEANSIRLLSRLTEFRGDPQSTAGKELLWNAAESFLPSRGCGMFNQALMELGSLICTPRNPKCDDCPLSSLCPTNLNGLQSVIPAPARQPTIEETFEVAIIARRDDGAILLRKCAHGERWAGLWDFPRFQLASTHGELPTKRELARLLSRFAGLDSPKFAHFATLRHQVTRFRIKLDCFTAEIADDSLTLKDGEEARWIQPRQLAKYPLSTTGRKLAKLLGGRPKLSAAK
jgi:A/G-specific adenine glycosylase